MNTNGENNRFQYTYSASEQAEIKRIRERYTEKGREEEDKMARLRRLDARVNSKAQTVALVFGVIGALILGLGMSLIMSELGEFLNTGRTLSVILGIILGIFGGALAALAYPVYGFVLKRERKRIAPEIIRLTDELMK